MSEKTRNIVLELADILPDCWYPQAGSQRLFLRLGLPKHNVFEVLYEGTRGPGKTDALIMDFCGGVGRGYGEDYKGILFRQTYPQLVDVISKTRKWIPRMFPKAKYNASEHYWTFEGGERLYLRQFNRDNDYWNFHGHEYPWIGWEELCNWATDVGYKRMMSCCRSANPNIPRKVRATTNPYGPGHNWVKMRFRLPHSRGTLITDSFDESGRREPPRIAIHGYIKENKILLDSDPDYLGRLRASARNKVELRAWLHGDWDIVAGGMFDDVWDKHVHIVKAFKIPDSWKIYRSFDWGSSAPFSVGWWAESDGTDYLAADGKWYSTVRGDMFRMAEWYGWNGKPNEGLRMLAVDVAKGIVEREIKMGLRQGSGEQEVVLVRPGPADSSIFDEENGTSIGKDMGKKIRLDNGKTHKGATFVLADKRPGSRKAGWEVMRTRLLNAKKPKVGIREKPGLFVFETCTQFIRTIPVLPRDDKDLDDVETKAEDHIADETRYMIKGTGARTSSGRTAGHV